MTLKNILPIISAICCSFFIGSQSFAQAVSDADQVIARSGVPKEAVAAVVNDKVVTTYDVRQRMRLKIISAQGQIPLEAMPQVQQQALRELVEEQLKLQETTSYEVKITDNEVNAELAYMAAQSNLQPEELTAVLASQGVSVDTLKQQIKASIAWPQLVQGRYRDRIRVSPEEVEDTLKRMREDASQEQYRVSEICIPVDDPSKAQQYYEGSLQLIEQMRRGVPFSVVAQQFSACTTAAVGGDMGWVRAGELDAELDQAIRDLPPGSVTNPIPSQGAFIILAVREKREAVVAGEPTFTLAYATAPEAIGDTAARAAFDKITRADVCAGRELRIDLGEKVGYALLENMTLDKIDTRFSEFIEDLSRGDTGPVIRADGAFHVAYVCDKDEGLGLPSREQLESNIMQRQLSRLSQQYLRDLERRSTVDIRLKEPLSISG